MMGDHVSLDELRRLRRGGLPPERIAAVLGHVQQCDDCRLTAFGAYNGAARTRELVHVLQSGDDEERVPLPSIARAAAAAAIAAGVLLTLMALLQPRRETPPPVVHNPPVAPPPVRVPPPEPPPEVPHPWSELVAQTLASGTLSPPAVLARLQPASDRHRGTDGPGDAAIELSPSGVVVDSTRPRFRWSAAEGVQYVVLLSHRGELVAQSEPLAANSWTPEQPLVRGRTYEWHLEIRTGAEARVVPAAPQSPPRFQVLSSAARREIERAREARPGDRLLAGILYARAGVREAAERELRAAAAAGDGNAAKLLGSLTAWPSGRVTLR